MTVAMKSFFYTGMFFWDTQVLNVQRLQCISIIDFLTWRVLTSFWIKYSHDEILSKNDNIS